MRLNTFDQSELKYMNDLTEKSDPVYLTNTQIVELIRSYRETKDQKCFNLIVNNFMKLLIKKARRYKRYDINIGDLVHYGLEGVIEAIEKSFNLSADEKFITYITIIMERRMKDGLDLHKGAVTFPKNIMTQQRKVNYKATDSEINFMDRAIIDSEDSKPIIYTKINIGNYTNELKTMIDIDEEMEGSIENNMDQQSLQFDIFYILETILTPIERDVIIHFFGLNGENAKAFDAIATVLGVSSQKVRKVRNIALDKIKNNPKALIILEKYLN